VACCLGDPTFPGINPNCLNARAMVAGGSPVFQKGGLGLYHCNLLKPYKSNQLGGTAMQKGVVQCHFEEKETSEGVGAGEGLGGMAMQRCCNAVKLTVYLSSVKYSNHRGGLRLPSKVDGGLSVVRCIWQL